MSTYTSTTTTSTSVVEKLVHTDDNSLYLIQTIKVGNNELNKKYEVLDWTVYSLEDKQPSLDIQLELIEEGSEYQYENIIYRHIYLSKHDIAMLFNVLNNASLV